MIAEASYESNEIEMIEFVLEIMMNPTEEEATANLVVIRNTIKQVLDYLDQQVVN